MGVLAKDLLTGQQKQTIINMYERLRHGVVIVKHGRSGKPNQRMLYCDVDMHSLYWREIGGPQDPPEGTNDTKSLGKRRNSFHVFSHRFDARRELTLREIIQVYPSPYGII